MIRDDMIRDDMIQDDVIWQQEVRDVTPLQRRHVIPDDIPADRGKPATAILQRRPSYHQHAAALPALPHHTTDSSGALMPFDAGLAKRVKSGRIRPDSVIDLHDYSVDDAYQLLQSRITQSHAYGHRLLLVITGKGRISKDGILKRMLPLWCEQPPLQAMIIGIRNAYAPDGGDGAYYVHLRRKR